MLSWSYLPSLGPSSFSSSSAVAMHSEFGQKWNYLAGAKYPQTRNQTFSLSPKAKSDSNVPLL